MKQGATRGKGGGLLKRILRVFGFFGNVFASGAPLCDRCKYDYGNVCMRPERPNAMSCPDFKRK